DEIKRLLAKQIISPVLFEKCCRCAVELGIDSFYECGPGRTLAGMLKKIDGNVRVKNFDKISDFDPLPNGSHFKSD
ncbi:MAG: hypothetical protein LBB18_00445, partial [Puniceicoccales bacterium]|nr:hypothetical protein [Puniceicoccales bacterium]